MHIQIDFITYFAFEKSVVHPVWRREPPLPARAVVDVEAGLDPIVGPDKRSGSQARPDMIIVGYEVFLNKQFHLLWQVFVVITVFHKYRPFKYVWFTMLGFRTLEYFFVK